jgi:hypothetical protein
LQLFEQSDGVELGIGLQQQDDRAVLHRLEGLAGLADASFDGSYHLAELVAVLLVLVHLVVRDSLAGHAASRTCPEQDADRPT